MRDDDSPLRIQYASKKWTVRCSLLYKKIYEEIELISLCDGKPAEVTVNMANMQHLRGFAKASYFLWLENEAITANIQLQKRRGLLTLYFLEVMEPFSLTGIKAIFRVSLSFNGKFFSSNSLWKSIGHDGKAAKNPLLLDYNLARLSHLP